MKENEAILIADKYVGRISTEDKIKWLSTEVVEVGMSFSANEPPERILEELGDCAFLISHIISRYSALGIEHFISEAAKKMTQKKVSNHHY